MEEVTDPTPVPPLRGRGRATAQPAADDGTAHKHRIKNTKPRHWRNYWRKILVVSIKFPNFAGGNLITL